MLIIFKKHGFTLIELMIVVGLVAILAIISVAIFTTQVREGKRSDATSTLTMISLAEERYRTSNATYGNIAQVWNNVTTSPGGYYTLSISNTSATGYTISATAIGNQANDKVGNTVCSPLTLTVNNGAMTKSPTVCWP